MMGEDFDIGDAREMIEGDDLVQDAIREAVRSVVEQEEEAMLEEIRKTDFDETPIIDLVWVRERPMTTVGDYSFTRYLRTVRHTSPAPPMEASSVCGERCEIYRVTKPLLERIESVHGIDVFRTEADEQ